MTMRMMHKRIGWVLLLAALCSPVPSFGQASLAELRGTVADESGAVLPGVSVTAVHAQSGTTRTAVTSETGTYMIQALPLGTYTITVELSGFATIVREGFALSVGQSA